MEENKKTTPTTDDGQPTTDDAPLKNEQPVNNENTNINTTSNETIEAAQLVTTNEKQETRNEGIHNSELITQNMEVHHHTHPAHGKKTWKNYFWEFLMLFLAVFCGFIAENWREYYVERHKEKEYMESMATDLQKDISHLQAGSEWLNNKVLTATNITIELLNKEPLNDSIVKEIYKQDNLVFRFLALELDDRTSSQLKNAGGMRLILDKTVLDSLANYWYFQKTLYAVRDNLQLQKVKAHDIGLQILSEKYFTTSSQPLELTVKGNPKFINGSESLLPEYANRLVLCREVTKNYLRLIKKQSDIAVNLINLIKKEYHLE